MDYENQHAAEAVEPSKTVEEHAKDAGTPDWLLAATKAHNGWATGREVNRPTFDAAVERASTIRLGS